MGTPSMSQAAQLGIHANNPVEAAYEFVSCNIGKTGSLVQTEGIRGTRSRIKETVVAGTYTVGGQIVMVPTPGDLDDLLPWILGADEAATDTFALAETLPERYVTVDKVAKVATYAGCKVNTATFRSAANQDLTLTLDVAGKTETLGDAASFPSLTPDLDQPYIHHNMVLTLGGAAKDCISVEIAINNFLLLDRFRNTQTRAHLPEGDRVITLTVEVPYTSDETGLYDPAIAGIAGIVKYTKGNQSITFTFANLKAAAEPIQVPGRGQEIITRLSYQAFQSSTTKELVVTNDSTSA